MVGLLGCTFGDEAFVAVVVGLDALHVANLFILEVRKYTIQKIWAWDMVGVQHHNNLPISMILEAVVDVACLGICLIKTTIGMYDPQFLTFFDQIGVIALVAEVCLVGITNVDHRFKGFEKHVIWFARHISGDHVDLPVLLRFRSFGDADGPVVIPFVKEF